VAYASTPVLLRWWSSDVIITGTHGGLRPNGIIAPKQHKRPDLGANGTRHQLVQGTIEPVTRLGFASFVRRRELSSTTRQLPKFVRGADARTESLPDLSLMKEWEYVEPDRCVT